MRVGIIGIGWLGPYKEANFHFQEFIFKTAQKSYESSGLDPRKDIDGFISCQEDFWEGVSISDEFAPDPLGGARRPTFTVAGDLMQGLAEGYMMIRSNLFNAVAIEAHSLVSDIRSLDSITLAAFDPQYREIFKGKVDALAAMDMNRFMNERRLSRGEIDELLVLQKRKGIKSSIGIHSLNLSKRDLENEKYSFYPLKEIDKAPFSDFAINVVLAKEDLAKKHEEVIWIDDLWYTSHGNAIDTAEYGKAFYIERAFKKLRNKVKDLSEYYIEVDDRYSYKLLQHLEAIGFEPRRAIEDIINDNIKVNECGGLLSSGQSLEATSGLEVLNAFLQLTHKAGQCQVKGLSKAIVVTWRGLPSFTGGIILLSGE